VGIPDINIARPGASVISADDIRTDDQYNAECDKKNECNSHVFGSGFIVLF
jgi:hypothetical protein